MFYLTTHSTHFIYGYMASDIWLRTKKLGMRFTVTQKIRLWVSNTFYLRLYGVRHMVKDQEARDEVQGYTEDSSLGQVD